MTDMNIDIIIAAAAAAFITAIATWLIVRGHYNGRMKALQEVHQKRLEDMEKLSKQAQENYDKALSQMRETVVASMTAETEKLLRKREKEGLTEMAGYDLPKSFILVNDKKKDKVIFSHLSTKTLEGRAELPLT